MSYEIVFTDEAIEDLAFLSIYEIQFTFSAEQAQDRIDHLMDQTACELSTFPGRNAEKAYGFTNVLRRKHILGKYSAFYWIAEDTATVHVDRIVHSKADFTRIHFGN